jgi:hypothetical protein
MRAFRLVAALTALRRFSLLNGAIAVFRAMYRIDPAGMIDTWSRLLW